MQKYYIHHKNPNNMCYSKEVQLITSLIIFITSISYYFYYKTKYKKKWSIDFLGFVTIGFLCIGGHQFFEFLSLLTENSYIYKIGLILSISSIYFFIRSLEILANEKVHSTIVLYILGALSIYILAMPVEFSSAQFYVRHSTAFLWAFVWIVLFVFWHIIAIKRMTSMEKTQKTLFLYILAVLDVSFFLSIIYTFVGYIFYSVNVCTDSPSIWCTFYVVQVLLVPFFYAVLPKIAKRPKKTLRFSWETAIKLLLLAFVITLAISLIIPFFDCFSWKLVFP